MYKAYHYINAGTIEVYRYGRKARALAAEALTPNENGFYGIQANGMKYWTIGTSEGKYGEYAKYGDTYFSVNSVGTIWAKVGSNKEEAFKEMVQALINYMIKLDDERVSHLTSEDEEEE